ncbi:hypothetical protein OAK48_00260 [Deltaproteobacteria bacterium]|nr:hypothetical protein [Deltaproteobacteria bacterium]
MKIVVTEPLMIAGKVRDALNQLGEVVYGPFKEDIFMRLLPDCEVLMVRLDRYIGPDVIRNSPKLRYILTATTGLDHIDQSTTTAAGVRIICLRDCMDQIIDVSATAEHTWGLLLALVRKTSSAVAHVVSGGWDRNQFWGRQLKGKQLGIVGHGRIGAMVAVYGAAFGMKVVAHDIDSLLVRPPANYVALDELIEQSDVISVHLTAGPENIQVIDRSLITRMKPGAYFINTARGMIADSSALAEAIISGHLAGVAVDVLAGEEQNAIDENPLLACIRSGGNVLITPHIGGATIESIAETETAIVGELKKCLINP